VTVVISRKILTRLLRSCKSVHFVTSRAVIHLHDPQTPNQRDIRECLTINVVERSRVEAPVLGFTSCRVGYRTEINPGSRVEGEWMTQGVITSGKCDRVVANFGSEGRSDRKDRRVVGNLILGDDGREVEGSVHKLGGGCN